MDTRSAESITHAIAAAVGGSVEALQTEGETRIVRLADGRAPVLVCDGGYAVHAYVDAVGEGGGLACKCLATTPVDALVKEVAASVTTWSRSKKTVGRLTLFALVPEMTSLLCESFDEPWTARFSGGHPVPEEAWFHGVDFDAAVVGIVQGRVSITIAGELVLLPVVTSDEWLAARKRIVEGVRAQRRSYGQLVARSEDLQALAEELRSRLEAQLGRDVALVEVKRPTHLLPQRWLQSDGTVLARLEILDGSLMLTAGPLGDAGWRDAITNLDLVWPQVLAAAERAGQFLDLGSLSRGSRYRVLQPLQTLSPGALLTFLGFVDIDNHYGSYDFADASGSEVSVTGDFSIAERHPFAATYRYLELVQSA